MLLQTIFLLLIMPSPVGKGAVSFAFVGPFVRPSVCLCVRSSVPKFGMKVPHLWCDSQTSFKVKRSKVKVARSRDQSEPSWLNAVPVSLAAGGAYRVADVGQTQWPHFLFNFAKQNIWPVLRTTSLVSTRFNIFFFNFLLIKICLMASDMKGTIEKWTKSQK